MAPPASASRTPEAFAADCASHWRLRSVGIACRRGPSRHALAAAANLATAASGWLWTPDRVWNRLGVEHKHIDVAPAGEHVETAITDVVGPTVAADGQMLRRTSDPALIADRARGARPHVGQTRFSSATRLRCARISDSRICGALGSPRRAPRQVSAPARAAGWPPPRHACPLRAGSQAELGLSNSEFDRQGRVHRGSRSRA